MVGTCKLCTRPNYINKMRRTLKDSVLPTNNTGAHQGLCGLLPFEVFYGRKENQNIKMVTKVNTVTNITEKEKLLVVTKRH